MIAATIAKYFGSAIESLASVSAVKFTSGARIHQLVFAKDRQAFASSAEVTARKTMLSSSWSAHALQAMSNGISTAPRVDMIPDITTMPFGIRLTTSDVSGDAATAIFKGPFEAAAVPRDSYAGLAAGFDTDADFQRHLKDVLGTTTTFVNDRHDTDDMAARLSRLYGRPVLRVDGPTMCALGPYLGRGITALFVHTGLRIANDTNWQAAVVNETFGTEVLLTQHSMNGYIMRGEEQISTITFTRQLVTHFQTGVPYRDGWGMRVTGVAFTGGTAQWSQASVTSRLLNGDGPYGMCTLMLVSGAPVQFAYVGRLATRYDNAPLTTPFFSNTSMGSTWPDGGAYVRIAEAQQALGWNETYDMLQPGIPALPRTISAYAVGRPPGVNGFYLKGSSLTTDTQSKSILLQDGIFGGMIENSALVSLMRTYIDDAAADPANRRQAEAAKAKLEQSPDGYVGFCSYPLPVSYAQDEIESTSLYVTYDSAAIEVDDPVKAPRFYDIAAADGTKLSTFRNNANASVATPVLITVANASVAPSSSFLTALTMPLAYQVTIEKVPGVPSGYAWDCSAQRGATTIDLTITEAVMLVSAGATPIYLNTTSAEVDLLVNVSANERALALSVAMSDANSLDLRELFPNAIPDVSPLSADARARAKFVMFGQKMTSLRALVLASLAYAAV